MFVFQAFNKGKIGHFGCAIVCNELARSSLVCALVVCLVLILRMHRFSRVGLREPSVPSNNWNNPTLYERRDAMSGCLSSMDHRRRQQD